MVNNGCKASFVTARVIIFVFIEYKILTVLLYSIVCQMHVEIIKIASLGSYILLCSEAGKTFLIDENSQGVDAIDQGIDSQVKL